MRCLFILMLLAACSPKFEVGDCLLHNSYESWEQPDKMTFKILEVGKGSYRVSRQGYERKVIFGTGFGPYFYEAEYKKVVCPQKCGEESE